ncbi:MAG: glycosyltransferase, partial [Candidatus Brocadiia bacterium]|nr:glycosyltransferase [Candidatus Brocadiia bacterium]
MAQGETKPSVLHVNDARTWRGGEQQTLYLARGMAARGLRAELVCRPGSALAQKARESGLVVHEVRMRSELDLPAALRIARLARRGSFNILHAHTAHAHALILLARRLFRARCRLVVHRRIEFPVGRRTLGLGRLKYGSGVDAYVAISNGVKESLVAAGIAPWRIFPVRSCTDPERFASAEPDPKLRAELGVPEDAYVVGSVGYLVGHKDHANLLRAAASARESLPNLWVVIVGPGPLREELLKLAEELGMSEHVVLTGFRGDIPQLLLMFDVFALSSSEEGICSSVLAAMASRCPVVGTDAAGVREA